jgi:hypothetical protein
MILRLRRGGGICALLSLILSGCATSRFDSERPLIARDEDLPALQSIETKGQTSSVNPGWRQVVYRGEVRWRGGSGGPIEGAVVSVCDGEEIYHSTLSDERGAFTLPVDLYGTPERGTWKPETYYALLVRAPSGEWTKRRLREVELGGPLKFEIEPSRS